MEPIPFRFLPSPFFNHRPPGTVIDLLVVHAISLPPGSFGGPEIDDLFLGRINAQTWHHEQDTMFHELAALKVSAHFLINRLGNISQYVPILLRAWHAGISEWQGRHKCNDFSVGVELEGTATTPFEPIQYQQLVSLVVALQTGLQQRKQPGFSNDQITGHQHIAPQRKWDPGPHFDWHFFKRLLSQTNEVVDWPLVWE